MDKHLLGGILWTAGAKWSVQLLTWLNVVVVARFLAPADFGLVGLATVYLGVVKILSEFGFGSAVVNLRGLSDSEIKQINGFSVLTGSTGFALSCALAWPLGHFFRSPQLPAVVVVMSTTVLFAAIQTVPYSLLQRSFQFKYLSVAQTITTVVQSACTLILAILGWGYWALVIGNVLGVGIFAGTVIAKGAHGFMWPRLSSIRHALQFSGQLLVAYLSWTFYSDADFLVAGRVLGTYALGVYSFGWNLATVPVEKITSLVGQVTPAVFSAKQSDHAGVRRYFLILTEGLSVITFPMAIGLAVTASDLVPLVFGRKWIPAVGPMEVLALFASARSIGALLGPMLAALGEARFVMWANVSAAVLMPTAFLIGSRWGSLGIAWGWVAAYPVIMYVLYRRAFRRVDLAPRAYFKTLRPAVTGTICMALVVLAVKQLLAGGWPPVPRLLAEIVCGAATYAGVIFALHRDRVQALTGFYRRMRAGGAAAVAE